MLEKVPSGSRGNAISPTEPVSFARLIEEMRLLIEKASENGKILNDVRDRVYGTTPRPIEDCVTTGTDPGHAAVLLELMQLLGNKLNNQRIEIGYLANL